VHGEPRGVIAAVLEPTQSLDEDGGAVLFADVPDDSAHTEEPPVFDPEV
jgi:hypothetical protein